MAKSNEDKARQAKRQEFAFRLRVAREQVAYVWRSAEFDGEEGPLRIVERMLMDEEKKLLEGA
jgi:hypothetical protein